MVIVVADLIAVFEDAADFDIGEIECHFSEGGFAGFFDEQVLGPSRKGDDGSVGVDGARLDVSDLESFTQIWDLNGGEIFALFREHLDSGVNAAEVQRVVGDFLDVEVDGGGTGCFGVGGHLELFLGGLLELGAHEDWRDEGEEKEDGGVAMLIEYQAEKGWNKAHDV